MVENGVSRREAVERARDAHNEAHDRMRADMGRYGAALAELRDELAADLKRLDDRLWSMSPRETRRGVPGWMVRAIRDGSSFRYPLHGVDAGIYLEVARNGPAVTFTFVQADDPFQRWTLTLEQEL